MIENSIIDITYVQEQMEMKKKEEILKNHPYSIWHSEKEDVWYTYLPDDTKPNSRRKIKKKLERDLHEAILVYYATVKPDTKSEQPKNMTIKSLFYEFMSHKTNEVNSGTIRRMMADWNKFYKPNSEFTLIPVSKHRLTRGNKRNKKMMMIERQIFHSICTKSLVARICEIRPSRTFLLSSKLTFSQLSR